MWWIRENAKSWQGQKRHQRVYRETCETDCRSVEWLRPAGASIRKITGTYRYQLTETGQKAITAMLAALRSTVRELIPEAA
jgi:hypothetical protein